MAAALRPHSLCIWSLHELFTSLSYINQKKILTEQSPKKLSVWFYFSLIYFSFSILNKTKIINLSRNICQLSAYEKEHSMIETVPAVQFHKFTSILRKILQVFKTLSVGLPLTKRKKKMKATCTSSCRLDKYY